MAAVRRGDIVLASLDPTVAVEIRKTRPVVVVSNDHTMRCQLAVVVPLTKNTTHVSPSHTVIPKGTAGLSVASKVLTEHDPEAPWITSRGPRQAHLDGFDLHANLWVPATDRVRLEQLCRRTATLPHTLLPA